MEICGVICELNPAHNGHKYIFEEARRITGADYIIAAMSGDYVQRGEPAVIDKYSRTKMALSLGADAVIELPGIFATGSAQYFARGAVSLLAKAGVRCIVFGSENGNIDSIKKISREQSDVRQEPNDILGIEYIKAIEYLGVDIKPYAVKRLGAGYNDKIVKDDKYSSAGFIRDIILEKQTVTCSDGLCRAAGVDFEKVMPTEVCEILSQAFSCVNPVSVKDFDQILFYRLNSLSCIGYSSFFDVFDDLSDKIKKNLRNYKSFEKYCAFLKSRDIALSHLRRALLHILLGYTDEMVQKAVDNDYFVYMRLLGFKSISGELISELSMNKDYPLITCHADLDRINEGWVREIIDADVSAADLYTFISMKGDNGGIIRNDFSCPMIKL